MQQRQQFKMNLSQDVMGWVADEARKNCRSKSAQIVFVLRSAKAAGGSIGVQAPLPRTTTPPCKAARSNQADNRSISMTAHDRNIGGEKFNAHPGAGNLITVNFRQDAFRGGAR